VDGEWRVGQFVGLMKCLHCEMGARFDFTPLEEKATSLREVLLENGWTELAQGAEPQS
jgi:hypothetical protein